MLTDIFSCSFLTGFLILPNIVGGIAMQLLLPGSQVINEHTQISRGAEVSADTRVAKATILTHKPVNSSTEVHITSCFKF